MDEGWIGLTFGSTTASAVACRRGGELGVGFAAFHGVCVGNSGALGVGRWAQSWLGRDVPYYVCDSAVIVTV